MRPPTCTRQGPLAAAPRLPAGPSATCSLQRTDPSIRPVVGVQPTQLPDLLGGGRSVLRRTRGHRPRRCGPAYVGVAAWQRLWYLASSSRKNWAALASAMLSQSARKARPAADAVHTWM